MSKRPGDIPRAKALAIGIFVATVVQLTVATFATGLPQFAGKGFAARLALYPVMMLLVPVAYWLVRRRRAGGVPPMRVQPLPWTAIAFLMAPFLVDVSGNSANLYNAVTWWDDVNHFVNWLVLCIGVGLLLSAVRIRPLWVLPALVTGLGALMAIVWEIGEYFAFIRGGTELSTAYQDTLGDEALGSLGAAVAGLWLFWWQWRQDEAAKV
jgi:hypothetical protein